MTAERLIQETSILQDLPAFKVLDPEMLTGLLAQMNEQGADPVLVGFDATGTRFLAYCHEIAGDEVGFAVTTDDPHGTGFDYADVGRCDDCGAFWRRSLDILHYPAVVM